MLTSHLILPVKPSSEHTREGRKSLEIVSGTETLPPDGNGFQGKTPPCPDHHLAWSNGPLGRRRLKTYSTQGVIVAHRRAKSVLGSTIIALERGALTTPAPPRGIHHSPSQLKNLCATYVRVPVLLRKRHCHFSTGSVQDDKLGFTEHPATLTVSSAGTGFTPSVRWEHVNDWGHPC